MSAPVLAPVVPIRGTLNEITQHLDVLYDLEAMAKTAEEQQAVRLEIAQWIKAEIGKVDRIADYMRHAKAQQLFASQEIKRLRKRKATFRKRYERLKESVVWWMEFAKRPRLEGCTSTLTLQACPISVDILDESAVPIEYKSVTVTMPATTWEWMQSALPDNITPSKTAISKSMIAAAIQTDKIQVPGATLVTDKMTVVAR